jgi:hypothetical protein
MHGMTQCLRFSAGRGTLSGMTRLSIAEELESAADNMTQKENAKVEAQLAIARAMMRAGRPL